MKVLNSFSTEVKSFSKTNWWVYVIYFLLMTYIFTFERKDTISVFAITSVHFVADIFIMMMIGAYARMEYSKGTYFQIISLILFLSLKLYTGLVGGGWHYLAADPLYILAAVKNFYVDVRKIELKRINLLSMFLLGLALMLFLIFLRIRFNVPFFNSAAHTVQTIGIFVFAIALSVTDNEKFRYKLAVTALFAMVGGSAWETVSSLMDHKIVGLALSYFLLPLTVLVYYIKNWPHFIQFSDKQHVGVEAN